MEDGGGVKGWDRRRECIRGGMEKQQSSERRRG